MADEARRLALDVGQAVAAADPPAALAVVAVAQAGAGGGVPDVAGRGVDEVPGRVVGDALAL